jgi:hypothetical protein
MALETSATGLLHELKSMLLDQNFKLADLSSDFIPPSLNDGKVCVDHLKCSVIVSACTRALKFRNIDQSNAPASTEQSDAKSSSALLLPSESIIKNLLVEVCDAGGIEDSALEAVLWLCVHAQRVPVLAWIDHNHYMLLLYGVVEALKSSSVNHSHQQAMDRVIDSIGSTTFHDIQEDLKQALAYCLQIDGFDQWKKSIENLKIKAINIESPNLLVRVYAWSSSDTIYLSANHYMINQVLLAEGTNKVADLILECLAINEGSRCIARKHAIENGKDPTLYSTPSSFSPGQTAASCEFVKNCVREPGRIAESVLFGGFLNLETLWAIRLHYAAMLATPRSIPLHGLCSVCSKEMAGTELPLLDPKNVSEIGFSCCKHYIEFM